MDNKSNRAETSTGQTEAGVPGNAAPKVTRLRTEIENARDGLGAYVSDLDRRPRMATDLKLQLKNHKVLVGVVALAAAAGTVALVTRSRRSATLGLPWSPWRIAPAVAKKSRRVTGFLLGTAIPVALKAAQGVVARAASRQPRLAKG